MKISKVDVEDLKSRKNVHSEDLSVIVKDYKQNTTFTKSHFMRDPELILSKRYGEKFDSYRVDYKKSLNYDTTGFIPEFPITLTLELVNRCNLSCVMCYTINHAEKKYTLDIIDIERVLDECHEHNLPALVVGLGSEPLLYKGMKSVLEKAKNSGVMDIFLGTNGVLLSGEMSEFLVKNEVARLEISLDAATPDTYKKVRGKDELQRIEANIMRFIEIRKSHKSELPVLRLCFCVQELNYKEVDMFKDKWKDIADYIDFQQLIDFSEVDKFRSKDFVDFSDSPVKVPDSPVEKMESHCAYPFNSLHVWSNGNVTPCCTFYAKTETLVLGNIKESTLEELWNGEKINNIRHQLLAGEPNAVCKACLTNRNDQHFNGIDKKK